MRNSVKVPVIFFITVFLAGALFLHSFAKDMEECYHCGRTGQFNCPSCGNTGEVVCDGCGGAGSWVCTGEEGKGKCDNGYYVCPSCNGDGLSRPIPVDGNAGPCGQCGGSGKIECWKCHGAGGGVCDRCGGSGKTECQNGNCKSARQIGWKCPYCKGTGYLGDGPDFPPEWNDGVRNVPAAGDHIITDHSTWQGYYYSPDGNHVWDNGGGGGNSGGGNEGYNGNSGDNGNYGGGENGGDNAGRDPATGRDYIWYVDLGEGRWDVKGQTVTAERNGAPVSGVVDLTYSEPLKIASLDDRGGVHAYLCGENDFRVELEFNGDGEVSVERHVPGDAVVPPNVRMVIEYSEDGAPSGQDEIRRTVDFGGGSWRVKGSKKSVTAMIDGEAAKGEIELDGTTPIKLENFDSEKMRVRVYADDGFSVTLVPNGDSEVSIGRYEQEECVLADALLHFTVEEKDDEGKPESAPGDRERKNETVTAPSDEGEGAIPTFVIIIAAVCIAGGAAAGALFIRKKLRGKKAQDEE